MGNYAKTVTCWNCLGICWKSRYNGIITIVNFLAKGQGCAQHAKEHQRGGHQASVEYTCPQMRKMNQEPFQPMKSFICTLRNLSVPLPRVSATLDESTGSRSTLPAESAKYAQEARATTVNFTAFLANWRGRMTRIRWIAVFNISQKKNTRKKQSSGAKPMALGIEVTLHVEARSQAGHLWGIQPWSLQVECTLRGWEWTRLWFWCCHWQKHKVMSQWVLIYILQKLQSWPGVLIQQRSRTAHGNLWSLHDIFFRFTAQL